MRVSQSSFPTCAPCHGEFLEVIPLAKVVTDSLKNANVGFIDGEFDKVSAICAQEGNYGLDAAHPQVVEDNAAADCAKRCVKIKINENSIEAMVAIDENEIESGIGSCQVCCNAVGAIFDEAENGILACVGEVGICMGKADSMPVRNLKRIDSCMVASLISGNGGKKIERAVAISHANLKSGSGFD